MYTLALALLLLWAHTAAHRRQRTCHLQNLGSLYKLATLNILHKRRNVDAYRTALHAGRLWTVETTLCLNKRHLLGKAGVHLLAQLCRTICRLQFRHWAALNSSALLWLHLAAELNTPCRIAVCKFVALACALLALAQFLYFLSLLRLERAKTLHHTVKIDLVTIELRAIDTHKLCLSANCHTASTAHTCTVDHNGVQRHNGRNLVLLCELAHELHHYGRTNGNAVVNLLALDHALDTLGHESLVTIRAIIGHDYNLVRYLAHLLLKDNQIL